MIEQDTFDVSTGLRKNNMTKFSRLKTTAARYANSTSLHSPGAWRLTTIIEQAKCEDCSATTVITGWWGGILTLNYFYPYLNI